MSSRARLTPHRAPDLPLFARLFFWSVAVAVGLVALSSVGASSTRYDDQGAGWTGAGGGTWTQDTCSGYSPYSSTCTYNNVTNATFTRSVTGATSFTVGLCRDGFGGNVDVILDGATVATVDSYSASTNCTLTSGPHSMSTSTHTVGVKVKGTKNASSSDYYVTIDWLDTEAPAPVPTGPVTQADLYVVSTQLHTLSTFVFVIAVVFVVFGAMHLVLTFMGLRS